MDVKRPLISLRKAAFRYGERQVFADFDLDIHAGEVLTILGANGSGKSTLLRCIGGALPLASGQVLLGTEDLARLDPRARARQIGIVFQDHVASFPFCVADLVSMGRAPYLDPFSGPSPTDKALVEEILVRVGILHLKNRAYTTLSGGERQLALIARTLAQQPLVILLDEPTSHLDLQNQVRCMSILSSLAADGVTLVMTSHDPSHAFLNEGRTVLMGTEGSILVGPTAEIVTEERLSASYGTRVRLVRAPGQAGFHPVTLCSPW
jgi:iron complex transport system ATP-binding protein